MEREHELECIRQEALVLNRQREDEARRVATLKEAAVTAEREKEELRKRRREEATARRLVKEKVACVQLMRQLLPLSLGAAIADLTKRSWQTPTVHQVTETIVIQVLHPEAHKPSPPALAGLSRARRSNHRSMLGKNVHTLALRLTLP